MDGMVAGRLNKQIAEGLGISMKTVEQHRARVMEKLQVDSLAELVRIVVRSGCDGAAGISVYVATAVPVTFQTSGNRSFGSTTVGTIFWNATAVAPTEAQMAPGGGGTATVRIVKWVVGTRTVLASQSVPSYSQQAWRLKLWGAEAILSCELLGVSLTALDCDIAGMSGPPFVGGPVGASFSAFEVVDQNKYLSELSAAMIGLSCQPSNE